MRPGEAAPNVDASDTLDMSTRGVIMEESYRALRRRARTRIVVPPSRALTAATVFGLVGALTAGWFLAAAGLVVGYVVVGGTIAGRAATWHVYAVATSMLLGCGCVAFAVLRGAQGEWYGVAFLAGAVAAAVAMARAAR